MNQHRNIISLKEMKAVCSNCSLQELCLPIGLSSQELEDIDQVIQQRQPIKRGEALFRDGMRFKSIYAVRTGCFKTVVNSEDGREQVTGFHMSGELLGLDALAGEQHACTAIALEDSEVCELPFGEMDRLSDDIPTLNRHFLKLMSREIVRDQKQMLMLGNMRAEERLAAFLLNLSQRFATRGFSPSAFHLRMTRNEIGSYLGLKLETVSRGFSHLQAEGIIKIQGKYIEILQSLALQSLVNHCPD